MAYRKMYLEILILFLVMLFTDSIWYFVFDIDNATFDRIINLVWAMIVGSFVNYFYMKKAQRTIAKAKESYFNMSDRFDYLKKVGGTSFLSLL